MNQYDQCLYSNRCYFRFFPVLHCTYFGKDVLNNAFQSWNSSASTSTVIFPTNHDLRWLKRQNLNDDCCLMRGSGVCAIGLVAVGLWSGSSANPPCKAINEAINVNNNKILIRDLNFTEREREPGESLQNARCSWYYECPECVLWPSECRSVCFRKDELFQRRTRKILVAARVWCDRINSAMRLNDSTPAMWCQKHRTIPIDTIIWNQSEQSIDREDPSQ